MKIYTSTNDRINFGKHRGKTVQEVIDNDCGYVQWASRTIDNFELRQDALLYLVNNFRNIPQKVNPQAASRMLRSLRENSETQVDLGENEAYAELLNWEWQYIKDFLKISVTKDDLSNSKQWKKMQFNITLPAGLNLNLRNIITPKKKLNLTYAAKNTEDVEPNSLLVSFTIGFPVHLMKKIIGQLNQKEENHDSFPIYLVQSNENYHSCHITYDYDILSARSSTVLGIAQSNMINRLDENSVHEGRCLIVFRNYEGDSRTSNQAGFDSYHDDFTYTCRLPLKRTI